MTTSSNDQSRAKFFRQSGWMVSATLTAGICMFAVHVIYPYLGDTEYGLFTTLLAMLNVLMIPSLGLQATFAQQAAAAVTPADEAGFVATVRGILGWILGLWTVLAMAAWFLREPISSTLTINTYALMLVMAYALCQLIQPVLFGVLQGRQNFLWLGWSQIINGAGRLLMVIVIVVAAKAWLARDPKATQALTGAFFGIAASVLLAGYHARSAWGHRERVPIDWRPWLKTVAPLTLGLGAFQLILSVDALLVRTYFGENQTGNYNAAGTLARGLVIFTSPLAMVMFPKIVHSRATGKKSNALGYTLVSVAILGALAAAGCTVVAWFLEYVVAHPDFSPGWLPGNLLAGMRGRAEAMRVLGLLIPWFVWCMVPLALSNVLLNNLLANKQYRAVPFLVLAAAAYVATVMIAASPDAVAADYSHFTLVIKILGLFNLLFLAVCLFFTWRAPGRPDLAKV